MLNNIRKKKMSQDNNPIPAVRPATFTPAPIQPKTNLDGLCSDLMYLLNKHFLSDKGAQACRQAFVHEIETVKKSALDVIKQRSDRWNEVVQQETAKSILAIQTLIRDMVSEEQIQVIRDKLELITSDIEKNAATRIEKAALPLLQQKIEFELQTRFNDYFGGKLTEIQQMIEAQRQFATLQNVALLEKFKEEARALQQKNQSPKKRKIMERGVGDIVYKEFEEVDAQLVCSTCEHVFKSGVKKCTLVKHMKNKHNISY